MDLYTLTQNPDQLRDSGTLLQTILYACGLTNDTSANHGASAGQLAEVLQSYAAPDAEALPMNIAQETFQEAYAFLLNAVAQDDRPALIAYMRRDLDSVAEQELAAPSVQQFFCRNIQLALLPSLFRHVRHQLLR